MNKKIEDYIQYYVGCKVIDTIIGIELTLIGVEMHAAGKIGTAICFGYGGRSVIGLSRIKPLLRPLSSMTEEEQHDYAGFGHATGTAFGDIKLQARRTAYLLSHHFDLFGLIDAGLAIDKTSIK